MQQELFPAVRQSPERPAVLVRLNPEQRRALVRVLARLLVKTIRPPKTGASDER
jgi:hypothetical protein